MIKSVNVAITSIQGESTRKQSIHICSKFIMWLGTIVCPIIVCQSLSLITREIFYLVWFPLQQIIKDLSSDKCAKIITITLPVRKISIIFHLCHSLACRYVDDKGTHTMYVKDYCWTCVTQYFSRKALNKSIIPFLRKWIPLHIFLCLSQTFLLLWMEDRKGKWSISDKLEKYITHMFLE